MRLCAMAKPKCRTEGCLWLSPCRKGFLLAGEFKMCSKDYIHYIQTWKMRLLRALSCVLRRPS